MFLLSEDKALREKLQGMIVTDQTATNANSARKVRVYFGQPDQELTAQEYPYVTIDMVDIQRDPEREHRGIIPLPAYMDSSTLTETQNATIHMPIPVMIDYQITTYARHPRHDRELIAQLMYAKLPPRFGVLEVVEKDVTSGNTETITTSLRRMDVMDISKRDVTEQSKRLFVNAVTVRVSSEVSQDNMRVLEQVFAVKLNLDPTTGSVIPGMGGRPGKPQFTSLGSFTIVAPPVTP